MNYIVNPMWFYWINVLVRIDFIIGLFIFILILILGISSFYIFFAYSEYLEWNNRETEETEQIKFFKKLFSWFKLGLISLFISTIILVAIPSETTIYKMMVANYATTDNVDVVLEKITQGVDYIFDKIEESEKK